MKLSAVELELQPEAFQATEELRLASGELSSVISELGRSNQRLAGAGFALQRHGQEYEILSDLPSSLKNLPSQRSCVRFWGRSGVPAWVDGQSRGSA
jgi:hypothetical protein